ncbi:MAG: peptidylprolyl isomerase [Oscillospiraceae bacterium]
MNKDNSTGGMSDSDAAGTSEAATEETAAIAQNDIEQDEPASKPAAEQDAEGVTEPTEPTVPTVPTEISESDASLAKQKKKHRVSTGILAGLLVIAILVLAVLCLNIFAPQTFNRIFNSTALTRGDDSIMTIGDYEISVQEYNHYLYPIRAEQEKADPNYWKTNAEQGETIKNNAVEMFRYNCAMLQWAKDEGITITDEDKKQIEKTVSDTKASFATEAEYYAALEQNFLTTELYQKNLEEELIFNKLYQFAYTDSEMSTVSEQDAKAYAEESGALGAKHILFGITGDAEADAAKLALAEDVLLQLKGGADFDTLMNKYTEDPGISSYPDGYTFGPGKMVPEFEEAVKALKVGEMSEIVQSEHGYHIIVRTEPDYVQMNDAVINARAGAKIEEYREAMKVKLSRGYDNITMDQTFWNYPVSPEAGGDTAEKAE